MKYLNYPGSYGGMEPGFNPSYSEVFTGYNGIAAGRIGASTSVQTANQLAEVNARLNEGMSVVEPGTIGEDVFDAIPRDHFREMNQLAKLAGAEISMHAPIIDPSGFPQQGNWTESSRAEVERKLLSVVERSHDANPEGNIPVTIHAASIPAAEWNKDLLKQMPKKLNAEEQDEYNHLAQNKKAAWMKERELDWQKQMAIVINQQTGDMTGMKREVTYYPMEGKKIMTPRDRLRMVNNTEWVNQKFKTIEMKKAVDDMQTEFDKRFIVAAPINKKASEGLPLTPGERKIVKDLEGWEMKKEAYEREMHLKLNSMYDIASQYGDDQTKKDMDEMNKKWVNERKEMTKAAIKINNMERGVKQDEAIKEYHRKKSDVYGDLFTTMNKIDKAPELYVPVEKFAQKHASETFSNVAYKAYKQFKEHTPIISVENWTPNIAFSRADQLKSLIDESRKKFVKKAVADGMDRKNAREAAEKVIGVTWDIAHINMLRKHGYGKEEIIKETEKISPYVKHVHMVDNFGFTDSHLPPGMGNVPVKEMMEKLHEGGYDKNAIVEAGNFVAQFKTSGHLYALENVNSPIYSGGGINSPTWGEARGAAGGYSSYGMFLPDQHFSMYGTGFSSLPQELGGSAGGKGQRFSGTPMD